MNTVQNSPQSYFDKWRANALKDAHEFDRRVVLWGMGHGFCAHFVSNDSSVQDFVREHVGQDCEIHVPIGWPERHPMAPA